MDDKPKDVTLMLRRGADQEQLLPMVYDELMILARHRMAKERGTHTLQATALVHEAYIKLAKDEQVNWRARGHFYGAAAEAMRRILIDHARKARSEKRGGGGLQVTMGSPEAPMLLDAEQVLALHEAMASLEAEDPQAAEVTRLRFFSGLSMEETAEAMGISVRSVYREWSYARARLFEMLGESG